MGWLVGWNSKAEVVEHLKRQAGERLVKASVVGNVLWTVERAYESGDLFIRCCLLSGGRFHQGVRLPAGSDMRWGYKDLEESMGPAEVSCPLAFLDMVPVPKGEYAARWRERVRAHHAQAAASRKLVREARPGDRVRLREGCKPAVLTVVRKLGRSLICEAEGGRGYKVAPRFVVEVISGPCAAS
jgi:hypothetical protein